MVLSFDAKKKTKMAKEDIFFITKRMDGNVSPEKKNKTKRKNENILVIKKKREKIAKVFPVSRKSLFISCKI